MSARPVPANRVPLERLSPTDDGISRAVEILRDGGLVGLPTETVYGLAARADSTSAIESIFAAKDRPRNHPVIVHLSAVSQVANWMADAGARLNQQVERLAEDFWPGPLTMIVPKGPAVLPVVTGGRPNVALRIPAHPVALAVLAKLGLGVAAPSANRFGRVSPTRADHVAADLEGRIAAVLDGGACDVGVESTIVDLTTERPEILRHGGVTSAALAESLGTQIVDGTSGVSRAPGMKSSHYAPLTPLRVVDATAAADARDDQLVISGASVGAPSELLLGTGAHFARNLYWAMREADRSGASEILVVPPEDASLLAAILDRVHRAAQ